AAAGGALPARRRGRAGALQRARAALDDGCRFGHQPVVSEPSHLVDDRQQRLALVGELVLDAGRRLRVAPPDDDALLLERAEPLGERPRADPAARVLELREPARAL